VPAVGIQKKGTCIAHAIYTTTGKNLDKLEQIAKKTRHLHSVLLNQRYRYFNIFLPANDSKGKRLKPLTGKKISIIKECLVKGVPVLLVIPVYEDFLNLNLPDSFYDGPKEEKKKEIVGWHAVAVVGYDDYEGGFKVRNSWGKGWGHNGDAYISYEFVKNYAREAVVIESRD
jgi:hypothetical protein